MNEVMNAIRSRRSVRNYTDRKIEDEVLAEIMDAAIHAHSGNGLKTWRFTVITNREMIAKLKDAVEKDSGIPFKIYDQAAAVVIPTNKRDNTFGIEDNSAAIMSMMIAAQSFGVGSVWINRIKGRSDLPSIRAVFRELGIPEDHIAYGTCVLGYPDPEHPAAPYKEKGDIVYVK